MIVGGTISGKWRWRPGPGGCLPGRRNISGTVVTALLLAILLAAIAGCSKDEDRLRGKWYNARARHSIEFLGDGTLVVVFAEMTTWTGKYSLPETGRLKVSGFYFSGDTEELIFRISINGDRLVLTDPMGKAETYQRAKPAYDLGEAEQSLPAAVVLGPAVLDDQGIRGALSAIPTRTPSPLRMKERLNVALRLSRKADAGPADLHEAVLAFREALAHSGGHFFPDVAHGEAYYQALGQLCHEIRSMYRRACLLERDRRWDEAGKAFQELLSILDGEPEDSKLLANVRAHYQRVARKAPGRRSP